MHEKVNARLRESCLLAPSHLLGRIHSTYHTAFSFIYVLFCQQIFPHYLIKLEFLLPQLRDLSLYREKGGSKGVVRLAHVPTDTIAKMIGMVKRMHKTAVTVVEKCNARGNLLLNGVATHSPCFAPSKIGGNFDFRRAPIHLKYEERASSTHSSLSGQ